MIEIYFLSFPLCQWNKYVLFLELVKRIWTYALSFIKTLLELKNSKIFGYFYFQFLYTYVKY